MESVTLADLRIDCRQYSGQRQSGYFTDDASASTSLDRLINAKLRKLRSLLISKGGAQLYAKHETWSLVSGTADYKVDGSAAAAGTDSPLDRVLDVHLLWSATHKERVRGCTEAQFQRLAQGTWSEYADKGWLLREQTLYFSPTPLTTTSVDIVYIPRFTALSATTDTVTGPEGMRECIALEVGVQVRGELDLSTAYLEKQLADAREMMLDSAEAIMQRDPARIQDVSPEGIFDALYDENWEPLPPP